MGARPLVLVVPRADQQHVADHDPAAAGAPARLEHHRARQVAAVGGHLDVGRAEPEPARVAVEHRAEHARRVEPRQAQPLDVAARRDERAWSRSRTGSRSRRSAGTRHPAPVAGHLMDAPGARMGYRPLVLHPRAPSPAAAGGSSTRVSFAGRTRLAGAEGSEAPPNARPTASALSSPEIRNITSRAAFRHGERKGHPGHQRRHARSLDPHGQRARAPELVVAGEQRRRVGVRARGPAGSGRAPGRPPRTHRASCCS